MKIKTSVCYNLEILCFTNIMTADQYYIKYHNGIFDKYYHFISEKTRENIQSLIKKQGYSMLSPTLTLLVSSLDDFNDRNIIEMLKSHFEIEDSMNKTPYSFSREKYDMYFYYFDCAIIPLINELEEAGLYSFWHESKLPQIKEKCKEIDLYLAKYKIEHLVNQFRDFDNSDFTVYLGSFVKPHGIKICGNNILSDFSYEDKIILSNLTHEVFHPAFDFKIVKNSLNKLAEKPWVKNAFNNQNPNSGYYHIDGFIEEHIVEALGIYVLCQLGVEIDPYEYFKIHDEGSHVISPHFYDYLNKVKKSSEMTFEEYFIEFVEQLNL